MKKIFYLFLIGLSLNGQVVNWQRDWICEPINYSGLHFQGYLGDRVTAMTDQELLDFDIYGYLERYHTYGGQSQWECLGEYLGKYLHGMTKMYQYYTDSRKTQLKARMDTIVSTWIWYENTYGHVRTYRSNTNPYTETWQVWGEAYTLIGALEYYQLFGNEDLLDMCRNIGDRYYTQFYNEATYDLRTVCQDRWDGTGRLLQAMVKLYRFTGTENYINFAQYMMNLYVNDMMVNELLDRSGNVQNCYGGNINLEGSHPHASCLPGIMLGILDLYMVSDTTPTRYLQAAEKFVSDVVVNQLYITGSAGMHEDYQPSPHTPSATPRSGGRADEPMEGCANAYWPYLNYIMYYITGDLEYLDNAELGVYNSLLACNSPQDWPVQMYYTPLNGYGVFEDQSHDTWQPPCCRTSFARTMGLLPDMMWVKYTDNGIGILGYEPGYFTDTIKTNTTNVELEVTVTSQFPRSGDNIKITITPESSRRFKVFLRVPAWASSFTATVGSNVYQGLNSTMVEIDRTWSTGDTIEVEVGIGIHYHDGADHNFTGRVAIQRGPQVLSTSQSIGDHEASINFSNDATLSEAQQNLPAGWVGDQIYTSAALGSYRLVPYADAPQAELIPDYQAFNTFSGTIPASSSPIALSIPPVARFKYDLYEPRITNETVTFDGIFSSDADGSIVGYSWDFGDGQTATGQTATRTYSTAGTRWVKLTVTDNDDLTNTDSLLINVHPYLGSYKPYVYITANTWSGTSPLTVNFNSSGFSADFRWQSEAVYGIDTHYWNFGDETTASTADPSHEFSGTGAYKVTYRATDDHGLWAETYQWVNVISSGHQPPVAKVRGGPEHITAYVGNEIEFVSTSTDADGTIVEYEWDFGDNRFSNEPVAYHTYIMPKFYQVRLTVTDNHGYKNTVIKNVHVFHQSYPKVYNSTVYVDPTNSSGGRNGSIGNPYNSWQELTFTDSTRYLFRSGTSLSWIGHTTITGRKHVHIGTYDGTTRMSWTHEIEFNNCTDVSIDNIHADMSPEAGAGIDFTSCQRVTMANCEVTGVMNHAVRIDDVNRNILMYDNHIHNNQLDGFWIDEVHNFEFRDNRLEYQNLAFNIEGTLQEKMDAGQGDGMQFTGWASSNKWLHGNYSDRSHTGNKFNIIKSGVADGWVIEGDYYKSPGIEWGEGAGIHVGAKNLEIKRCIFEESLSGYYNVMGAEPTNIIHHNLFINNLVDVTSYTNAYHNVFFSPKTHSVGSEGRMINNIWYLENSNQRVSNASGGTYLNNIQNIQGVDGSRTGITVTDPQFINVSELNFRIGAESPAINAGYDLGFYYDYLNNPVSGIKDIGAYEYSEYVPVIRRVYFTIKRTFGGIRRRAVIATGL